MEVYRLCNEVEYQIIGNTMSFDNIGSIYKNNSKENNHNYHNNQKYIHFFKEYTSLFYLYLKPGTFICTYLDIQFMRKIESVVEYAIPNHEILPDYLKKIEKVCKYMEYEDYFDDSFKNNIETVYDCQSKVFRKN